MRKAIATARTPVCLQRLLNSVSSISSVAPSARRAMSWSIKAVADATTSERVMIRNPLSLRHGTAGGGLSWEASLFGEGVGAADSWVALSAVSIRGTRHRGSIDRAAWGEQGGKGCGQE